MIKVMCCLEKEGGVIAGTFEEAEYFLLMDAETEEVLSGWPRDGKCPEEIAARIVEEDCEAVITGPMEEPSFKIIADEGCVTRYYGAGLPAKDAVRLMNEYALDMIPDFVGGTGCHSGEGCHSHPEEG